MQAELPVGRGQGDQPPRGPRSSGPGGTQWPARSRGRGSGGTQWPRAAAGRSRGEVPPRGPRPAPRALREGGPGQESSEGPDDATHHSPADLPGKERAAKDGKLAEVPPHPRPLADRPGADAEPLAPVVAERAVAEGLVDAPVEKRHGEDSAILDGTTFTNSLFNSLTPHGSITWTDATETLATLTTKYHAVGGHVDGDQGDGWEAATPGIQSCATRHRRRRGAGRDLARPAGRRLPHRGSPARLRNPRESRVGASASRLRAGSRAEGPPRPMGCLPAPACSESRGREVSSDLSAVSVLRAWTQDPGIRAV